MLAGFCLYFAESWYQSTRLSYVSNYISIPLSRGISRTAATSKMEVIIVSGFLPLTIIAKCSILDVTAVLDPPLFSGCIEKNIGLKCVKEIWIEDVNFV